MSACVDRARPTQRAHVRSGSHMLSLAATFSTYHCASGSHFVLRSSCDVCWVPEGKRISVIRHAVQLRCCRRAIWGLKGDQPSIMRPSSFTATVGEVTHFRAVSQLVQVKRTCCSLMLPTHLEPDSRFSHTYLTIGRSRALKASDISKRTAHYSIE